MSAADEYFKKADMAAKKGNYEYAVELLIQGLIVNPKAAEERRKLHRYMTITIQERGGNPQGGMAVRLKAMPLQATIKKLTMQKKWDEAVVEIEKSLKLQPQSVSMLCLLAQCLDNLEAIDGAIIVLEDVVNLDKTNVEAYRKLGVLWAKKDEPEKAIEYWAKVQQYKPDDKEAGKAIRDLSAATMVKKAEEKKKHSKDDSFRTLLKSEDESADLEKKAKVIRTDEDRREAIRFKKDEIRKEPTNSRLWREFGDLFRDLREWDKAEKSYLKAMEVNPHDLFVQEKIGHLKETRVDHELEQMRDELKQAKGTEREAELRKALREKTLEGVLFKTQEYDRRVRAHPTDYELKVRYGRLLMQAKRWDEAIEQFQKSVKDPKLKVPSLGLMGTCFREKSLYDVAEQQYTMALDSIADKDSDLGKEIMYNLGILAERRHNKDDAVKWYQQIMSLDIGYRDVSARASKIVAGGWPEESEGEVHQG